MARYLITLAGALTLALSPAASAQVSGITQTDQAVNICHAVGDSFQLISVSGEALQTHTAHAGDLVPAPAGGCPATSSTDTADQLPPALSPTPDADRRDAEGTDDRLSEQAGGGRAPAGGAGNELPVISERSRAIDGIPLTGAPADLILLIGIGMLFTGLGGRLAFRSL